MWQEKIPRLVIGKKGIRQPDATDIGKLANYFDISVGELLLDDLRFKVNKSNELDNIIIQKIKLLTEDDKNDLITMINALTRNKTK